MTRDPYVDPATGVLRNRLGITDPEAFAAAERELTYFRVYQRGRHHLPGTYDLDHLRAFHHAIFADIYDWAGELRTVAMAKTDLFALPQHIESYLSVTLAGLAAEDHLRGRTFRPFVERLAHYLSEVNAVHPFREGNGRTQRAFFGQLARDAGWRVAWSRMDPDENVAASIAAMRGDERPLAAMLAGLAQPETIWPPFRAGG